MIAQGVGFAVILHEERILADSCAVYVIEWKMLRAHRLARGRNP